MELAALRAAPHSQRWADCRSIPVSFHEAAALLADPLSTTCPDEVHSPDEARFLTIGASKQGNILVVAHTERNDTIRIISARRATRREREFYEQG